MIWFRFQSAVSNTADQFVFGPSQMAHEDKWRAAYHTALVNAGIFLFLALIMFVLGTRSLVLILSAPALFFLGCMLAFLLMVRSGGDLAAVAWFVFGAGIYFGLGVVAGGLHVHVHSDFLFGDDTRYLLQVNLLNACSVFIVLAAAYPLANMRGLKGIQNEMSPANIEHILQRIFPYIVAIAAIGVGLKYVLFPVAESLLLRSIVAKIYLVIPSCFLLLGILWRSTGWQLKLIACNVFLLEILNSLIILSKYQIIVAMLALVIGMGINRRSVIFLVMSFMVVASVFVVINPLITVGRAHVNYDADKNTVAIRLEILAAAVTTYYLDNNGQDVHSDRLKKFTVNVEGMMGLEARLMAMGRRLDVATIQGYLIREYDNGRSGSSLLEFWAAFVPRVLWPEKPNMSRFGVELNGPYYYYPGESSYQNTSATAPTYSAEAYWNFGVIGVVIVSLLLGLAIGWLTRCWQSSILGRDHVFFMIAFPVAIWAGSVESWLVGTYLGEFIIFVSIYLSAHAFFALFRSINNRVRS